MPATTKRPGILGRINVPDVIGGLLLVGLGLYFAIGAMDFGIIGREGRLAPGGMPFLAGATLAVLGAGVILIALRPASGEDAADERTAGTSRGTPPAPADGPVSPVAAPSAESATGEVDLPGRSLAVWGLTVLAAVAGLYIGFLVGFALLIVAVLVIMERERLWRSALLAVVAGLAAHFVFADFLRIPLPEGVLW